MSPSRLVMSKVGRTVSGLIAFVLIFTAGFSTVSVAYAAGTVSSVSSTQAAPSTTDTSAAAVEQSQTPTPTPAPAPAATASNGPTVVRELTGQRSETKREFLLSNGDTRVVYYGEPVYYRDSVGQLQPVDPALKAASVAGRAIEVNRGAGFSLQLPNTLSGDWVSVSQGASKVSLRPMSRAVLGDAPAGSSITAHDVSADSRTYSGAFAGADLSYQSRSAGMKESIIVSAPTSSSVYSFDMSLAGLTPRLEADGSISLIAAGETTPAMTIPRPGMWDATQTVDSYSDKVHYVLSGSAPTYRLDVVADPSWLQSAARVFPVTIDPSIVTTALPDDTFIRSESGYQDTNYSANPALWIDTAYSGANWTEYTLVQPSSPMVTNMADWKSAGYTVASATVDLTGYGVYGTSSSRGYMCTQPSNLTTVTWTNRPNTTTASETPNVSYCATDNVFDMTSMVSYWQAQATAKKSCTVEFHESVTGSRAAFYSTESSNPKPVFTIDYSKVPTEVVHASAQTTASAAWFDGTTQSNDDSPTVGRGSVTLTWGSIPIADSYSIYLFNGNAYDKVATTTQTSWTSAGAGIYPADSRIASLTQNTTSTPFLTGTGLDLRDDPSGLYAKTAGTSVDGIPAYFFKVVPATVLGEASVSGQTTVTVQLANRTRRANEAPAHTTRDLGNVAGDSAATELDSGALGLASTDLSLASYGPPAELSRLYRSDLTASSLLATGWAFNFQSNVATNTDGSCIFTDARSGESYHFSPAGGSTWAAPHGLVATLTQDTQSGEYSLAFKGGTTWVFSRSGSLARQYDWHQAEDSADVVTYQWTLSGLNIIAANGNEIVVTIVGGQVTGASITTASGVRRVDYSVPDSSTLQVTHHLNSTESAVVQYSYNANGVVSTVTVPGFAPGGVAATWSLGYSSCRLARVDYPSAGTPRWVQVVSDTSAASATVSYPSRLGIGSADTTVSETYLWDPTGREIAHSNATAAGAACEGTVTTDYGPSGSPRHSVSAAGVISDSVTDAHGNVLISSDALGNATSNLYDPNDSLIMSTDPRSSVTTYTYSAWGDVLSAHQSISATQSAETSCTYDTDGRLLSRGDLVDPASGARAYTTYTYDQPFTSPTQMVQHGVALSATSTTDLSSYQQFDDFGQQVCATDTAGVRVSSSTYDLAGRLISQTDATGTITHHRYDVLGGEIDTSRTAGSAWADWTTRTVDPSGLVLSETSLISTAGAVVPQSTTTHTYDGSGNEVKTAASDVGTATTAFDAQGDVAMQWDPSATTLTTATAQVTDTNADGDVLASTVATLASDVTTYVAGTGQVASETAPGDGPVTYNYDADGNVTTMTVPADGGHAATLTTTYDLAGRQISSTDASGNATNVTYDLLGRVTSTALQGTTRGQSATYNSLGWVTHSIDANSIATSYTFDCDGRVTDQVATISTATAVTHVDYDAMGNPVYVTNPDGSSVRTTYDLFGRVVRRVETAAGGALAHDVGTAYDQIDRSIETSDVVTGGPVTDSTYSTSSAGANIDVTKLSDATRTWMTDPSGYATTSSLQVATSTLSVKAQRDNAHLPFIWTITAPAGWEWSMALYDGAGRMAAQILAGGGDATYAYAPTGRKSSESLPSAAGLPALSYSYTFTDTGRLSSVITSSTLHGSTSTTTTPYAFDTAGNITQAGATTFAYSGTQLSTSSVGATRTTYAYDSLGRRVSQSSPDASATYRWDAHADRLLGYTRHLRSGTSFVATLTYDASGQRTGSVVTSSTGGTAVTTTSTYTYEGTQLLRAVAATPSQTTTLTYLYDEAGRAQAIQAQVGTLPVYPLRVATTDRGDVLYITDQLGNAGFHFYGENDTVLGAWGYDAYGNPTGTVTPQGDATLPVSAAQAIDSAQILRYAGYAYDSFSGLYYCSQRYYDPATCQFISPDPARADGELSAYQYCGGDPVDMFDPTGLAMLVYDDTGSGLTLHQRKAQARVNSWEHSSRSRRRREWRSFTRDYKKGQKEVVARRKAAAAKAAAELAAYRAGERANQPPAPDIGLRNAPVGDAIISGGVGLGIGTLSGLVSSAFDSFVSAGVDDVGSTVVDTAGDQAEGARYIYRAGSQTDNALTDPNGVSFRDSVSSSIDGSQVFRSGAKVFTVDTGALPEGSVEYDGVPDGHVTVHASPNEIRAAVTRVFPDNPMEGLSQMEDGSWKIP